MTGAVTGGGLEVNQVVHPGGGELVGSIKTKKNVFDVRDPQQVQAVRVKGKVGNATRRSNMEK